MRPMSSESGFVAHAEECLKWLVARLDLFDPDELEADVAGGVVRISFPDGRNCVVNRQAAVQQIWMAEGATAWHFERQADGSWLDTKGRGSLPAVLADVLSRRLGRPVQL
jgi:iron donor protein CyaY